MERSDSPSRAFWIITGLLVIVGAFLRFYDLGGPSLWIDEVFTELYARAPVEQTLAYLSDDSSLTPFYFLTLHLYPTGSDFWLRSFSALFGVLAIPLFIVMIQRLNRDNWLALWAGAFLALNPYHIWMSRTARMYSLMLVLVLIVSYCFLIILRRKDTRLTWVIFVLASAAAYSTHYFTAALPFAQYILLGSRLRGRASPFRRWVVAQGIAVIPLLFWFRYLLNRESVSVPIGWIREPVPKDVYLTLTDMLVGYADRVPWYAWPGVFAALVGLVAGLVHAARSARQSRQEPDQWYWFWMVIGTLAITYAASYLVTPLYSDRYFVVFLPGLILLTLKGWQMLREYFIRRSSPSLNPSPHAERDGLTPGPSPTKLERGNARAVLASPLRNVPITVVAALIALTGTASIVSGLHDEDHYKEDWRGLVAYIEQNRQPGDGVVTGNPVEVLGVRRYTQGEPFEFAWLEEPDRATMTEFDTPVSRVWVIMRIGTKSGHQTLVLYPHARAEFDVSKTYLPPWIGARWDQVVEMKSFNGLALFLVDIQEE